MSSDIWTRGLYRDGLGYRKKTSKLEEQLKAAKADKYGSSRRKPKVDDDEDSNVGNADRQSAEEDFD